MSEKDKAVEPVPEPEHTTDDGDRSYTLPLIHTNVPEPIVNVGFWGGLGLAAVVGAIQAPVALAIGAGVVVARHMTGAGHVPDES